MSKRLSIICLLVIMLSCQSYKECDCESKPKYLPDRVEGVSLLFKPEYRDIGFHIRNVLKRDSLKRALNKKNSDKLFINPNYLYDSINVDVIPGSLIIVEGITPEYISSPITIGIGGVEMKDGPFIPGGTSLKILEVRTTNSTNTIGEWVSHVKVEYQNHIGWINFGYAKYEDEKNRAKDLIHKWIENQYCYPEDIMIYNYEGPELYKIKVQNSIDEFFFMKIDFWRRCDTGFYTKENKVFKIDSNFDLEVFNANGFSFENISSKQ